MDVSKIKATGPDAHRARVVDVETGETIDRVIEADAIAGKVRRFETKDGNLVRIGDEFVVIDEDRDIRIELVSAEPEVAE